MRKPSLVIIFLTVFIDLIGFGLVLPLLPNYIKSFGASGFQVGCIMAAYSLMQFLFAPIWGGLSDRIGRRPVLLVSTAGAAFSYAIFAVGSGMSGKAALGIILLSRVCAGICGANITVAQAYIADITPPAERSKRMGLIGMAFGLGFIVGPALAVFANALFGPSGPGWVASAICAINWVMTFVRLPESWKPGTSINTHRRAQWNQWEKTLRRPVVGFLILIFFLGTIGFTCFESTLGLLIQKDFQLDHAASAKTNAILFCICGIVGALVQAGPIGQLIKKAGEPRIIAVSLVIFGLSMAPLPFIEGRGALDWSALRGASASSWAVLLFAVGWLAVGSGLTRPPLFGMLSNLTPPDEQGATLGVAQGAGSLARVLGPPLSGWLFDQNPKWPYLIVSVLSVITGLLAWNRLVGRPMVSTTPAT